MNRSVTWASWDEELLALELKDLSDFKFDLTLTGFDTNEIDGLLAVHERAVRDLPLDFGRNQR